MERRGGSAAVYGGSVFYTVDAVTAISRLKNFPDDRRQGQSDNSSEKKESGFANILETEVSKTEDASNINVCTNGYTRMGISTTLMIKMRDYTYQR